MTSPSSPSGPRAVLRHQRLVVAGLHAMTGLLLSLQLYVRTLPPTPTPIPALDDAEAAWWGLWPVTYAPGWAVTLAAILILGGIGGWWMIELGFAPNLFSTFATGRARNRGGDVHPGIVLITLLLFISFYRFPLVHTRWGDAYMLTKALSWPDATLRLTHSWQAPLDVFLHSQLWLHFHTTFMWTDATPVYRLLSPLAGLLYLSGVGGLGRDHDAAPAWLTFGLLTSLGVMQLFFGYVENYSFAAAGVLLYLWLGLRVLNGQTPLWLAATTLALTHAFHPSTLVLAPSLLYLGWISLRHAPAAQSIAQNKRARRNVLLRALGVVVALALPMAIVGLATIGLLEIGGHGLAALTSTDRPGGGDARLFVPLWGTTTRWEHYTMFSWLHLRDFLNEQLLVAPVVLPALLVTFIAGVATNGSAQRSGDFPDKPKAKSQNGSPENCGERSRSAHEGPKFYFLALATIGYLLFVWVWNPDYGGQRDWDLFSLAAIPATLLLITTLPRRFADQRYLQAGAIPLLMLQWLQLATWLYQNTLPWEWPS